MPRASSRPLLLAMLALLLAIAVLWSFRGALDNGFVFDDAEYIVSNRNLDRGLTPASLRWAFSTLEQANWHPLTWVSHLLDATFFAPGPKAPHAVNLAIHAVNAALLLLWLAGAVGRIWPAAAAAALFALHPQRVESVAWIAERKDLLAGLFFMLTLLAYLGYLRRPTRGRYLAVASALALGLLAKPMLVTVPLVLLLLDFWPFDRFRAGGPGGGAWLLAREKLPLLALAAASSAVTLVAQARGHAVQSLEAVPLPTRLGNALVSYAKYLGAAAWPEGLSPLYPYPAGGQPLAAVAAAGAALAAATWALLRLRRHLPAFWAGWLWYLGMLVPVIGVVQVGSQAMADRYTYLPMVGLAVAVAVGASRLARRWRRGGVVAAALAAAALGLLCSATRRQVGFWRDDAALFARVLELDPANAVAHMNIGAQLADNGRLEEALSHFQWVALARPEPRLITNIGKIHALQGRPREAVASFLRALELDPGFTTARFELADALHSFGRREEAVAQYRQALAEQPLDVDARFSLASDLAALGRPEEAAAQLRELLRLNPGHREARSLLEQFGARLAR